MTYQASFEKEPLILALRIDMTRHLGKCATAYLRRPLSVGTNCLSRASLLTTSPLIN
jgi:hypothetical protein